MFFIDLREREGEEAGRESERERNTDLPVCAPTRE